MSTDPVELAGFLFGALAINKLYASDSDEPAVASKPATISRFSDQAQAMASAMGDVYQLLYCLENSIRELVESTLREAYGPEKWWTDGVKASIRISAEKRRDDDAKARWHGPRGGSSLAYVDFPQYGDIIAEQWTLFEPLLGDADWVKAYFAELNRTRRALAHTGTLTSADVERMEVRVRDWLRVVG